MQLYFPAWRRGRLILAFRYGVTLVITLFASLFSSGPETALAAPPADNGAAVLMYHRFGETGFPSTNIRIDQFEAHIAELIAGPYKVMPLTEIVAALNENRPLPERALGISIDDAYASVYSQAWPRLREAGLPFTVFVSTDALDQRLPGYMSWDQLKEMIAGGGVAVGHHSAGHGHMAKRSMAGNRAEIASASARFKNQLGAVPPIFAYPYGEDSLELRGIVAEAGFAAAFGQHSGAVGRGNDRFALPRFPLSENFGNMNRFRLVANALPLPVTEITPADSLIRPSGNPPLYGFTVMEGVKGLKALNCFASGNEIVVERLGERRIETRLANPWPAGRARINCTLPGPAGRWRWLGAQFYVLP